jgi:hypothetical protein
LSCFVLSLSKEAKSNGTQTEQQESSIVLVYFLRPLFAIFLESPAMASYSL